MSSVLNYHETVSQALVYVYPDIGLELHKLSFSISMYCWNYNVYQPIMQREDGMIQTSEGCFSMRTPSPTDLTL